eukprot:10045116-Alexandrium_andersonii.AAC.1
MCDFQAARRVATARPELVNVQPRGRWSALCQAVEARCSGACGVGRAVQGLQHARRTGGACVALRASH